MIRWLVVLSVCVGLFTSKPVYAQDGSPVVLPTPMFTEGGMVESGNISSTASLPQGESQALPDCAQLIGPPDSIRLNAPATYRLDLAIWLKEGFSSCLVSDLRFAVSSNTLFIIDGWASRGSEECVGLTDSVQCSIRLTSEEFFVRYSFVYLTLKPGDGMFLWSASSASGDWVISIPIGWQDEGDILYITALEAGEVTR